MRLEELCCDSSNPGIYFPSLCVECYCVQGHVEETRGHLLEFIYSGTIHFLFVCFEIGFLCSLSWPETHQAGLELTETPLSQPYECWD